VLFFPQEENAKLLRGTFAFILQATEERQPHIQDCNLAT